MQRFIAALLATVVLGVQAQSPDPLRSPECGVARARLERALEAASSGRAAARAALEAVRREAIEACLGRYEPRGERSGAPEPAIAVPPAGALPRTNPVPPPSLASPAPALVIPRPAALTTCDPGGCWDSEGRRLNSQGPLLVGPRGPCVVQGGVVHCP